MVVNIDIFLFTSPDLLINWNHLPQNWFELNYQDTNREWKKCCNSVEQRKSKLCFVLRVWSKTKVKTVYTVSDQSWIETARHPQIQHTHTLFFSRKKSKEKKLFVIENQPQQLNSVEKQTPNHVQWKKNLFSIFFCLCFVCGIDRSVCRYVWVRVYIATGSKITFLAFLLNSFLSGVAAVPI